VTRESTKADADGTGEIRQGLRRFSEPEAEKTFELSIVVMRCRKFIGDRCRSSAANCFLGPLALARILSIVL